MPLFTANIESVGGSNASFAGLPGRKLFNTARVNEIYQFGDDGSAFEYSFDFDGDGDVKLLICDSTVSEISDRFEEEYYDGGLLLNEYPYGDTDAATEVVYIDPRRILFAVEFTNYTKLLIEQDRSLLVSESVEELLLSSIITQEGLYDDGINYFRLQVRSEALYLDEAITALGFEGVRDTDWETIWIKSLS